MYSPGIGFMKSQCYICRSSIDNPSVSVPKAEQVVGHTLWVIQTLDDASYETERHRLSPSRTDKRI